MTTERANYPVVSMKLVLPLAGTLAALAAGSVLLGWAFDIAALKSILPGWVSMKPNTAVAFVSCIFAVFGLGLMFVLWRTYVSLRDTLGGSVDDLYAHIAKVGSGDFSAAIPVKAGLRDSVLGWLSATQAKLNDVDRERERAAEEIRRLNADLERRVQERTRQLEDANKELESFSYSVSHDLRAPLRHVQGYVELLDRTTNGQLPEKARRYLKTITAASGEMGQLIDDLLAFSHMGRDEMRATTVALGSLLQDTIRSFEMETKDRAIVWKIAPLPQIVGDPAMVRQVLANLVGNAVKYSRGRDPAEIEIGCGGEEDGRGILFVRDNGAGFDMQYVDKLFGVFQRLHRADEFEGTGIGLAIVRRIIARHGGRVWAEGALNEGATFYFTLQLASSSEEEPLSFPPGERT